MQQKPNTVDWRSAKNHDTKVFMNSDDVIKGFVLRVPDESESVFCKGTWNNQETKLEWQQDINFKFEGG